MNVIEINHLIASLVESQGVCEWWRSNWDPSRWDIHCGLQKLHSLLQIRPVHEKYVRIIANHITYLKRSHENTRLGSKAENPPVGDQSSLGVPSNVCQHAWDRAWWSVEMQSWPSSKRCGTPRWHRSLPTFGLEPAKPSIIKTNLVATFTGSIDRISGLLATNIKASSWWQELPFCKIVKSSSSTSSGPPV